MKELCAFQPQRYWPGRWDKLEMTEPPAWLLLYLRGPTRFLPNGSHPSNASECS